MNVGIFRGKRKAEFCLGALGKVFPRRSLDQVSTELLTAETCQGETLRNEVRMKVEGEQNNAAEVIIQFQHLNLEASVLKFGGFF